MPEGQTQRFKVIVTLRLLGQRWPTLSNAEDEGNGRPARAVTGRLTGGVASGGNGHLLPAPTGAPPSPTASVRAERILSRNRASMAEKGEWRKSILRTGNQTQPPTRCRPRAASECREGVGGSRRLAMCSWFVVFVTSFPEKQKKMQISHLQYLEYNISPRAFINMAPGTAPAPASSVGKPNSCYAYFSARPLRRWLLSRGDSVWD